MRYRTLFSEKGAPQFAPPLKTTLGRKKATKMENSDFSPKGCALWVHILERPFWGNGVLIYMFDPHQYHVLSIKSTENMRKAVLLNFPKMHIFSHVFVRKKCVFLCQISNYDSFMSFWSQKLGSKYDISRILKFTEHQKHPAVCAPTRHKPSHFIFEKMPFSTIFDQVLFLVGVHTGPRPFRKISTHIRYKSYFDLRF